MASACSGAGSSRRRVADWRAACGASQIDLSATPRYTTLAMATPITVTITDPRDLSDRQLLLLILERLDTMATIADNTSAAVTALDTKVDTLIAAITPALTNLQTQLKAAQDQVSALQAGDATAATTLQATIDAANAEAAKVDAAVAALNPPAPAPSTP